MTDAPEGAKARLIRDDADADTPIRVEHFVLCERATVDKDRKPHLVAPMTRMEVTNLPGRVAELGVYVDFWGAPFGTHKVRFEITGPPGSNEYEDPGQLDAELDTHGRCGVLLGFKEVTFTKEGVHTLAILLEGVVPGHVTVLAKRNFEVVQAIGTTWGTGSL